MGTVIKQLIFKNKRSSNFKVSAVFCILLLNENSDLLRRLMYYIIIYQNLVIFRTCLLITSYSILAF